jgi:photosystem II stability/assembly factor-like uncharacterized protein
MPRPFARAARGAAWAAAGLAALAAPPRPARAQLDSLTLAGLRWRTVGPANFEGRVSDIAAIPSPSRTFFVASVAGGIWKTTNGGTTYRPLFDDQRVISMGALAIAPSDTQQVWAGTGEQNSRNTIEPGRGVYKSTDGGLTWKPVGLEKTQHVGRIAVHPTNPNVVYVAALGAAWASNPERGLYKTEDGGATWKLVKFISDRAGFVDVALDPKNPNTVWAASYERGARPVLPAQRRPGLGALEEHRRRRHVDRDPRRRLARDAQGAHLDERLPAGPERRVRDGRGRLGARALGAPGHAEAEARQRPVPHQGRRAHVGEDARRQHAPVLLLAGARAPAEPRPRVVLQHARAREQRRREDARTATQGIHVDHHALWIDPNDPERMVAGNDGGVSVTHDGGGNWEFGAQLPIAQFYDLSFDFETPYNVCAGAQDNGSWCGPSRRKSGPVTNAYWFTIAGGDGFYTAQHPREPWVVWGESQGGNISRLDLRTGERVAMQKPTFRPRYQQWEDSMVVARGDTARPATAAQRARLAELRARQRADSVAFDVRFNWETPFFLSAHNPDVLYAAGSRVLKSLRRGDSLYLISPDLSKRQTAKIDTSINKTGGITLDATGAETYGTVTALAESPAKPGFLYAGTDDGNVWATRTDGAQWEQIPARASRGCRAATCT